jgi:hypothetical protein
MFREGEKFDRMLRFISSATYIKLTDLLSGSRLAKRLRRFGAHHTVRHAPRHNLSGARHCVPLQSASKPNLLQS